MFECWTTLAAISQRTSRIRLGQMVGCAPYRNPGLLAKITSNIDVISGGRLDWGIGAGWYEHEFKGYGYDFLAAKDRIAVLRETVEIVKSMWTTPDTVYEGRFFSSRARSAIPSRCNSPTRRSGSAAGASSSRCASSPVTPTAPTSAASPTSSPTSARCLKQHCKDVGRDYDEIAKTWSPEVCHTRERGRARRPVVPEAFWGEPFDSWQDGNLVGTPEQVAEKIQAYIDLGCTGFVPWCSDYPDTESLRLFGEKVIPNFR